MKTVFFDIDTQIDFVFPCGALYAAGAEAILPNVARLNHYAAKHAIPLISSVDAHSEDDPEFRDWPHHCVVGTLAQQKPAATLLEKRAKVPNTLAAVELAGAQQLIVEKQTFSVFSNVNLKLLLDHFQAERYVVYGVVTEVCVKFAAFGLLETGKRVEIATDAIRPLNDANGAQVLADFQAAGGHLTQAGMIYA
jgi:nicotinamidase/pyrazinamidase